MTTMIRRVAVAVLLMFTASRASAITIEDPWGLERLPATGGERIADAIAMPEPPRHGGGMPREPEDVALPAVFEAQAFDDTRATAANRELHAVAGLGVPPAAGDSSHAREVTGIRVSGLPMKGLTLIIPSPAIWITLVGLFGFLVIGRKHKLSGETSGE
jgi:hypothetical protein